MKLNILNFTSHKTREAWYLFHGQLKTSRIPINLGLSLEVCHMYKKNQCRIRVHESKFILKRIVLHNYIYSLYGFNWWRERNSWISVVKKLSNDLQSKLQSCILVGFKTQHLRHRNYCSQYIFAKQPGIIVLSFILVWNLEAPSIFV